MAAKATRAEIVIMLGGLATIVCSFAPFYDVNGFTVNAWRSELAPITLYPVFAGFASGGVIALQRFANANLAVRLGSFTWEQVHLLLGLLALLITGGYFFRSGQPSFGFGFWGLLGGSIALVVGAAMLSRERPGLRGL